MGQSDNFAHRDDLHCTNPIGPTSQLHRAFSPRLCLSWLRYCFSLIDLAQECRPRVPEISALMTETGQIVGATKLFSSAINIQNVGVECRFRSAARLAPTNNCPMSRRSAIILLCSSAIRRTTMDSPVKYAKSDGVHIAYRVFGDGPRDIVLIPGTLSHVEMYWEFPVVEYLLKRLTSFARVIVFDKRGQGLSDRVGEQTLEERIGDVKAVMDATRSSCAAIFGWSEGGPMSLMFTATYPERTSALVLCGSYAFLGAEMWNITEVQLEEVRRYFFEHWGEGILVPLNAPSRVKDAPFVQWFARLERATASPGAIATLFRANDAIDVRPILPSIHVPTLILHRVGDMTVPIAAGRYLAENISGAKFIELPGDDHMLQAFDQDLLDFMLDEVEEFITGTRHWPEPERVLVTVMFADIVGSTQRAAEMGDRRWRGLLDDWYALMRKELSASRGREIDTAGDGLLATFDGPARAVKCACSMCNRVHELGLQVRTGLHTGECELAGDKVVGLAVHIGARVAAIANPDEVLVSRTVKDLVAGSGLTFSDRGVYTLKGVPDQWQLYAVQ